MNKILLVEVLQLSLRNREDSATFTYGVDKRNKNIIPNKNIISHPDTAVGEF